MGQTQGDPHQHRRDEPRTQLREALPKARPETIRAAIHATLEAMADPDVTHSERKAAQERLYHLKRLAGWQ